MGKLGHWTNGGFLCGLRSTIWPAATGETRFLMDPISSVIIEILRLVLWVGGDWVCW